MTKTAIFSRREALRLAGIGGAVSLAGLPALAAEDPAALARAAYIWGLPLVQTRLYIKLAEKRGQPLNQLFGAPRLSVPADKIAGPNLDTLYGVGWLDLKAEPQVLSVPEANDRYYSIQLVDAYGDSFRYIGRRATGTKANRFAVVAPGWKGKLPDGVTRIDAPTNQVLVLTRTLVSGDADLPAALAVEAGYSLTPLSAYPRIANPDHIVVNPLGAVPVLKPAELGAAYFDELGAALADNPPPDSDRAFVSSLAALGIGPGKEPSKTESKETQAILAAAAVSADQEINGYFKKGTKDVNGWRVRYGVTETTNDPLERAALNVLGPGFHIAKEALYFFSSASADGQKLSGEKNYVLKFPAGKLPPADAFWSLTLYGGDFQLQENPINRYSIGDRTPGLVKGANGSLTIKIQHMPPAEGTANWLPAPAGAYQLCLRTYQPQAALVSGNYKLPPIAVA